MQERTYTPGPWDISESDLRGLGGGLILRVTQKHKYPVSSEIASLFLLDGDDEDEMRYNASLIASAPIMAEALDKICEIAFNSEPGSDMRKIEDIFFEYVDKIPNAFRVKERK